VGVIVLLGFLAAQNPDAVLKTYLAAPPKERAELHHPDATRLVAKIPADTLGCAQTDRPGGEPRISAGPSGRLVADWKAGGGRGAHREGFLVKDGKVLDVVPLLDAAEQALREGDLQSAMQRSQEILKVDPGQDEALGLSARVVGKLGDAVRADSLVKKAREAHPEGMAWRVAAYELALTMNRAEDAEAAREACFTAVRNAQLDDPRCFLAHAWKTRGGSNQSVLRQELEEALGRIPEDSRVLSALGVVQSGMARSGKSVDAALLAQAQLRLKQGLRCPDALEDSARGAALHALAASSLELGNGPCAGHAEAAVLADPTQGEYRRTLMACSEATILMANKLNRAALRDAGVDLALEGQAITMALMRDKAVVGGRRLPAFEAYTRARAQVRQGDGRLEISLVELNGPRRKTREEDAVAAAFMVHQVYKALYGDDAPAILNVRTRYAGDTRDYIFPMPDKMKPAWANALPGDKELADMSRKVVVRASE